MQILFIHQNIPGQFKHLIRHFSLQPGVEVWALGEAARVRENWATEIPNVRLYGYSFSEKPETSNTPYLRNTETNVRRGMAVVKSLKNLKQKGLNPGLIYGHPGWGEMLFVKDVFPGAKVANYCEFYFNKEGQDLGFDPEFPHSDNLPYLVRAQNMTQTQTLVSSDICISPTHWQKSRYPTLLQSKIHVQFDGVDCDLLRRDEHARFILGDGRTFSSSDEVVTFVNRNLEPMRGFHRFMRALPDIQKRRPHAHIVIVGGDGVSYSPPPVGSTYRALYCKEVDSKVDWSKIHFVGRVSYARYMALLKISSAHVYLTYPFVLSWSLVEAMAAGCLVIGSGTAPVSEFLQDGVNGLEVDFFDHEALVDRIGAALQFPERFEAIRAAAQSGVAEKYDLHQALDKLRLVLAV